MISIKSVHNLVSLVVICLINIGTRRRLGKCKVWFHYIQNVIKLINPTLESCRIFFPIWVDVYLIHYYEGTLHIFEFENNIQQ